MTLILPPLFWVEQNYPMLRWFGLKKPRPCWERATRLSAGRSNSIFSLTVFEFGGAGEKSLMQTFRMPPSIPFCCQRATTSPHWSFSKLTRESSIKEQRTPWLKCAQGTGSWKAGQLLRWSCVYLAVSLRVNIALLIPHRRCPSFELGKSPLQLYQCGFSWAFLC